ncbi:MAG: hypothetical protein HWE27_09155 [Gammaproteobacteria bacterium]|nr:hypothetical protein [Gammaproteobacteria bacterium]
MSTSDGLSQKTIQILFQDSVGFVWIGTQEGLNRYDGNEIKIFRHRASDPLSISSDVIRAITEDASGQILIATHDGLSIFNPSSESFSTVKVVKEGVEISRFNEIYRDRDDRLWLGSDGNGIFLIENTENNNISANSFSINSQLDESDIRVIFQDSRDRFWFGTNGKGLFLQNKTGEVIHYSSSSEPGQLKHNQIRTVFEDSSGRIWIGTRGGGLARYSEIEKRFDLFTFDANDKNSISSNRVYEIIEDQQKRLWIATDGGINVYQENSNIFSRISSKPSQKLSLSHNRVLSAMKDKGGVLWFGTLSGLNIWDPTIETFQHYRNIPEDPSSLSNNTVYSLGETIDNQILIGTFGTGIDLLNPNSDAIFPVSDSKQQLPKRVMTLHVDKNGSVWSGSITQGLEFYSKQLKKLEQFTHQPDDSKSISANGVTNILRDYNGNLWVSTFRGGLNRYFSEDKSFRKYDFTQSIYCILEDEEGYIWVGTDGDGLYRFDKNTEQVTNFKHDKEDSSSISGNIITSLTLDSQGRLWIGTQGDGLNIYEPMVRRNLDAKFTRLTTENGLTSSTINGVVEDELGNIWLSTVKGLSRISPDLKDIEHFNISGEIHENEFNQGAILRAKDGRLYFGGLNGVTAFYPSEVKQNSHKPEVILTSILIGNERASFKSAVHKLTSLELNHKDYLVAFEFAALDYANPKKNQYMYKLEGLDDDWIQLKNRSRATFTNLPAGEYTLKVKGSNDDGVWSDESINLRIRVEAAPWSTWWAYSIYSLFFCFLLILLIRIQARRLAQNDMFQTQVESAVEEKIELMQDHNDLIAEQYSRLRDVSLVDLDTLLPNEKYLMEQLELLFKLIGYEESVDTNFCFAIFTTREQAEVNAVRAISDVGDDYQLLSVAKWKSRKIVAAFNHKNSAKNTLDYGQIFKQLIHNNGLVIEKASYVKPFSTLTNSIEDPQLLMILLEFIDSHLDNDSSASVLGIEDVYQTLDMRDVAEIVRHVDLTKLSELFKISSS